MTSVHIRHYRVRKGRGYFEPTMAMKAKGFRLTPLGPDGSEARAKAERLNAEWDVARKTNSTRTSLHGTLGWVFEQYRQSNAWAKKAPRTKVEWHLAWKTIGPILADQLVAKIDFRACDLFYSELGKRYSLHKQHRVFKITRALLGVAIGLQLIRSNPTHAIENVAPKGRTEIWNEGEVVTLQEVARERGFTGLALTIAIAYDTALSPGDVIALTMAMRRQSSDGPYFETARAKTGRKVFATLSSSTVELLDHYLANLTFTVPVDQPFIRNRKGHVYNPNMLAKDFAKVRVVALPGDTRKLMDMRRTGNVEAVLGGAQPTQLSAKLSSTINRSNKLFDTYSPPQLDSVRQFDEARETFRSRKKNEGGA